MKGSSTMNISHPRLVAEVAIVVGMSVILVPLAAYGQREYLARAKTAEAKNTLGAIMRAATAAYERETSPPPAHRLCSSSIRVPAAVPRGTKYQPSQDDGSDFNTGDALTGWKCLKLALNAPVYYAYKYTTGAGSGKSGATATGFEATAQGDLDGNGVSSFFARGASIRNGVVVLSTDIYIENEYE